MSQRVAGCCCNKGDCDGTTLGTCCYTGSGIDPNCQGFCEGYDQLDNFLGRIEGTTKTDCDTYLGLEVGTLDDGSPQIVTRVQWTAYGSCETPLTCFCKEDITCAECAALGGKWQNPIPCTIACKGTCCIKNPDGTVFRCIDVANECDCKKPLGSTQTYTFARGLDCVTQGCVVRYCLERQKSWKAVVTTNFRSMSVLGNVCELCNNTLDDPYRSTLENKYFEIDERYFSLCEGEENYDLDFSQFNRTDIDFAYDNPPFGQNIQTRKYQYTFLGVQESCLADGVCISGCNCNGSTYVGNIYSRNIQIAPCCPSLNYYKEGNVRIPSPYDTGSDPDNPSTDNIACAQCTQCQEGCQ